MNLDPSQSQDDAFFDDVDLVYALAALEKTGQEGGGKMFAARGSGLYVSDDGGQTWAFALEQLGLSEPVPVTCLAAAPLPGGEGEVIAGAPGSLLHSNDGGVTWRVQLLPVPPPTVSSLAVSPNYAEDQTLFTGTVEDGIFISRDGGSSFVAWNFGLLDLNVMSVAISPGFALDETIFAGTETGIFRSSNGGRAWREVDLPCGFDPVLSLAVTPDFSPDGGGLLLAGTENNGLWFSADGGDTWKRAAEEAINEPVNAIFVGTNGLAALTPTGLFYTTDPEGDWQNLIQSLDEDLEIVSVLVSPGDIPGGEIVASLSDGTIKKIIK